MGKRKALSTVLFCAALAGCGTSAHNSTPAGNVATNSSTTKTAHVGAMLPLGGDSQATNVQLLRVLDPAPPALGSVPAAGEHLVAADFAITQTRGNLSEDVNNATTAIGSDNQIYEPSFTNVLGCKQFAIGNLNLAAPQSASGCVAFAVPANVHIVQVAFAPSPTDDSGAQSPEGQWQVP